MAYLDGATAPRTSIKAADDTDDPDTDQATADLLYHLGDAGKAKVAAAIAEIIAPAVLAAFGTNKAAGTDRSRYRAIATAISDPALRKGYEALADDELDQWLQRLVEDAVREAFADLDTKTTRTDQTRYLHAAANATDPDLKAAYLTKAAAITRRNR